MKYPQLVSTKARFQISDWLIKRLIEFEIEEPEIHARHLLSLLHTPLKIHALDLEDLKQPYRLLNKDNDELKRLTAVEILMKVTPETNRSKIVNFVGELHMKLQKIENTEENSMIGRMTSNYNVTASPISMASANSKIHNKSLKKIKRHHVNENPTKNYFLAFPALGSGGKVAQHQQEQSANGTGGEKNLTTVWSNLIAASNVKKDVKNVNQQHYPECSDNKLPQNHQHLKKKRYQKREFTNKRLHKANVISNDVQYKAQNATLSPKKMQKNVKGNANNNNNKNNNYSKASNQRNFYNDPSAKRMVNGSNRNTHLSNNAQNYAPKWDGNATNITAAATLGPWDMDFKGHWEMEHDPIGEFMQQQCQGFNNSNINHLKKRCESNKMKITKVDDEDFMRCLPTKLIDESLDDEDENEKRCFYQMNGDHSISSLHSKFDEKVKAIWHSGGGVGDDNDPLKSLTYKHQFSEDDGISLASLASSFASEKNSVGLFNFNSEQQQPRNFIVEVNVPPFYNEMKSQYGGGKAFFTDNYDCNNNLINNKQAINSLFGGRGAITKNSYATTAATSPNKQYQPDSGFHAAKKSDFIELGTNFQKSIWSEGYNKDEEEDFILKGEGDDEDDDRDDGMDEVDCTAKNNLSSIGTELKQWQLCPEDEEVSLINHSSGSAFKKFKPEIPSTIIRANYHPLNMNHMERSKRVDSSSLRESPIDNYLTSDKNHFAPIFKNGDFFTPDDRWDVIPYEKSEDGNLQYKNKTYHVWKNPNNIASNIELDSIEDDAENDFSKFTIKFALNDNNMSTQTEEGVFATLINRDTLEINEYCRRKIFDEYNRIIEEPVHFEDANKWRQYHANDDSNDYSFFSVNRVKSNNNNSSSNNNNNNYLMPLTENFSSSNHSSSSSICTITSTLDAFPVDPLDSWRNVKVENNNINAVDMNIQYTCKHSCWENCVNCTRAAEEDQFFKPLPASRLLKDELKMDGDEIMSVIQNLYISNGNIEEEDESEDDGCVAFDVDRMVNIIGMDDSIDGIEPLIEDESKFYETNVDLMAKCEKSQEQIIFENFDESALAKYQQQMDRDRMARLIKTCQDANNNICQDVGPLTKNRKRRHSTCQNYLEKKRYFSYDDGFSNDINPASWNDVGVKETAALLRNCLKSILGVNDNFLEPSKMLHINFENVFLIADPCLEMEYLKNQHDQFLQNSIQECGANYYRNILQHQHALVKHLDLSRPLTR